MSNQWSILIAAKQNRELPLQVLGVNYNLITLVLNKFYNLQCYKKLFAACESQVLFGRA